MRAGFLQHSLVFAGSFFFCCKKKVKLLNYKIPLYAGTFGHYCGFKISLLKPFFKLLKKKSNQQET
jgi:hypothetical protein